VSAAEANTAPVWRPVPGFEGLYEVSDAGQVRRLVFSNQHGTFPRARPRNIVGGLNRDGYRVVNLVRRDGTKQQAVRVHRLVLLAFVGPAPEGHVAAHGNGVRDDNRLANLRWATPAENSADMVRHGTSPRWERSGHARLTADDVATIRDRLARGETQAAIADEYGVSPAAVSHIATGRNWRAA
jgi:hypothetical protein